MRPRDVQLLPPWQAWEREEVNERLIAVMSGWLNARYMPNASAKDYCDCVGFIIGCAAELERTPVLRSSFPQDIAFHNRAGAIAGMREVMRAFPNWRKCDGLPKSLRPGDVLAVGPKKGGPGHGIFVSPWYYQLAHAKPQSGVHLSGMTLLSRTEVLHSVYRHQDPEIWLK